MPSRPRSTERSRAANFKRVLRFLRPYRLSVVVIAVCSLLSTVLGLAPPYLGMILIDDVIGPRANWHLLLPLALGMAGAYLLSSLIEVVAMRLSAKVGTSAIHDVRQEVYGELLESPLIYFARQRPGNLVSRINQDTQQLEGLLVDVVPYGIGSLLTVMSVLALLFHLSWVLTLTVLVLVAVAVLLMLKVFPQFFAKWEACFDQRGRLSALVTEVIQAIRVVKVFAAEKDERSRFAESSIAYRDAHYAAELSWSRVVPLFRAITMLGNPVIWLIGGIFVFQGHMTLGEVVAFSGYLVMLFSPVFELGRMSQLLPNGLAAASRIFDRDSVTSERKTLRSSSLQRIQGGIEFQDVSFAYESGCNVLHKLCFRVEPGETIGLVGRSGAGKSTIFNLICRLFEPDEGSIRFDGINARELPATTLRRQLGVVLQETLLLPGTIAENIAYARPDVTHADIENAAKLADAHDFIVKRPDGYETKLEAGGTNFSMGEKQRISLARALLREPAILMLDEPTASVDLETEIAIGTALRKAMKNRTTLIIAHRLSTLREVDRLLVLENGRFVEMGTPAELVQKDGVYARLLRLSHGMSV